MSVVAVGLPVVKGAGEDVDVVRLAVVVEEGASEVLSLDEMEVSAVPHPTNSISAAAPATQPRIMS